MVLLQNISAAVSAAVAALGSAFFISFSLFYRRRTLWSEHTQFCTYTEEAESRKRRVLVLGLEGAGKSSLLRGLVPSEAAAKKKRCQPTRGFNFMSLDAGVCQLDFLEIGSSKELRRHWCEYMKQTHVLLFVVDSSDRRRLPLAKAELHHLLEAEPQLPVVILGNKQDKPNAVSMSELQDALSLDGAVTFGDAETLGSGRKMFLLAAQTDSDRALINSCCSLDVIQELLLQLV